MSAQLTLPEYDENGINLTQIRENLRLTPLERIRKGNLARIRAIDEALEELDLIWSRGKSILRRRD